MKTPPSKPTQDFVPLKEVRDGIAVLKDDSMRAILLASSLNLALKSEDEQNAVIYQFQNFLNSLDFTVQIVIQSRELDIRPYIALLEERQKAQVEELIKVQTKEYIEFIKSFTAQTNIMTKNFFIVIPYTPQLFGSGKGIAGIFGGKKKGSKSAKDAQLSVFEENRTQLEQRVGVVEAGLVRTGVRVARLGTEEIVEVFYKLFNPGETEKPIQIN
ncbi:hypothetical protein COB55_05015 [Candidatus Wolfebacteria bacterium]|nr:MAG: hypothetical protein COB55_05015 [Candidatus Wolfebacteria bacterium]